MTSITSPTAGSHLVVKNTRRDSITLHVKWANILVTWCLIWYKGREKHILGEIKYSHPEGFQRQEKLLQFVDGTDCSQSFRTSKSLYTMIVKILQKDIIIKFQFSVSYNDIATLELC